jgi:PhnB protein
MPVKPIPDGYHSVTPYLIVKGAEKLLGFVKAAFDAEDRGSMKSLDGTIMHGEFKIGDSIVMYSDLNGYEPMPAMIHLYVPDVDATYRQALAAGATSLREPTDEFYGDRSAGVADAFGNRWWIATRVEEVSPEDLHRRAEEWMAQQAQAA